MLDFDYSSLTYGVPQTGNPTLTRCKDNDNDNDNDNDDTNNKNNQGFGAR